MRIGKPTQADYDRQWSNCLDCDDHVILLQAGMELDFHKCEKCKCLAPLKKDLQSIEIDDK